MNGEAREHLVFWSGEPHEGWAALAPGHGLAVAELDRVAHEMFGCEGYETGEVSAHYMPRVKWCQNYDAFACDNNGEWHGHWFAVKPDPDDPSIAWTLLWEPEEHSTDLGGE